MHGKTIDYEKKNPIMNEEFKLLLKTKTKTKTMNEEFKLSLMQFFFCAFQLDFRQ